MKNEKTTTYKERRIKMIREIARELREDRNRPADYAMRVARRYTDWYCK